MTTEPIVIFGTGRCGSTMLNDLLSRHGELAWLSKFNILFPDNPAINRWFMRAVDIPFVGRRLHDRVSPSEAYPFHERLHGGLAECCRDLGPRDIAASDVQKVREAWLANRTPKRNRLLVKFTGWPRVGFVKRILPDARFVHIVRDGRAVATSLLRVPWWQGWRGPGEWRYGPLSESDQAIWEASGYSFAVLAGIEWRILMDAAEAAKAQLPPEQLLEVRYEDLCGDPDPVLDEIFSFLRLKRTAAFERARSSIRIRPSKKTWLKELEPADVAHLNQVLAGHLDRYGYEA
ncbi:MAG: sulfotransferase [Myxococcota bacterium]